MNINKPWLSNFYLSESIFLSGNVRWTLYETHVPENIDVIVIHPCVDRHKEQQQYFLFTISVDFSASHTFSQTISFIIRFVLGGGISGIDLSCCCCSHVCGTLRVCVGRGGGGGGEGACEVRERGSMSHISFNAITNHAFILYELSLSQEFNLVTYSLDY